MVEATHTRLLHCIIVTPERAVLDETVEFVALPMYDGELGVLPGRAALIGRLGYGELRTSRGRDTHRFYVDGGFAQVRGNAVTVLTPRALRAEEINPARATQMLETALVRGRTLADQEARRKDQERARAQLRIARADRGSEGHA
jgi:F-type H+-transporting ATPase subunit epsilon